VATGGSWGAAANWTGGVVPSNAGDTATFSTTIATPTAITLGTAVRVGHLVFNSPVSYTITGTSTLTIDNTEGTGIPDVTLSVGSHAIAVPVTLVGGVTVNTASSTSLTISGAVGGIGPVVKAGPGGLTLSGTNTYAGGTNVSAGTLTLATVAALPGFSPLNIAAGASLIALPVPHTALTINGLTDAGTIDLTDHDAVVRGSSLAAVVALKTQGRLISSTAASDTRHITALGIILNGGLYGSGTTNGLFDGVSPAATDVLVRYTYNGDANLNGQVDGSDYSLIDAGYISQRPGFNGTVLNGWYNGDFNYDGVVDGSDYSLIDNAFSGQGNRL
jgi:autotransporter-associated beta strand protein